MKITLVSQSPWREGNMRTIIRTMGHGDELVITPANIDERAIRDADPVVLTTRLALAKADVVLRSVSLYNNVVVSGDSVVVHGDLIREKPENTEEAREFLRFSRDHPVRVVTTTALAWSLADSADRGHRSPNHLCFTDQTIIAFKGLTDETIEHLIADGVAMKYAGAISIDHPLYQPLIRYIVGDDTAASGLPIHRTRQLLEMIREEVF